jgi:hypothetical protein
MTTESLNNLGKQGFSKVNVLTYVLIGILVLCVGWLFYKVNTLEKALVQTQSEFDSTRSSLLQTQSELDSTRSTLVSTIDKLTYVQALAENADQYAHSHNNFSDSRLKMKISPITDPLQGILLLNGVTFYWNTSDYPELQLSNNQQIGLIAQELEQVYPELVSSDENGYKTVDYVKIIPVLVEAIKQQQLMIVNLQEGIGNLERNR